MTQLGNLVRRRVAGACDSDSVTCSNPGVISKPLLIPGALDGLIAASPF